MKVKVRKGYTLFVNNTAYSNEDIIDISDLSTIDNQSWKFEIIPEGKNVEKTDTTNRMIKRSDTTKKKVK